MAAITPTEVVIADVSVVQRLVDSLEEIIKAAPSRGPLWHGSEQIVEALAALEAYHKQGDEGVGETLKL